MTEQTMQAMDAALQLTGKALAKPKPKRYDRPRVWDSNIIDSMQVVDRELGGYVELYDYDKLLIAYEELQAEQATPIAPGAANECASEHPYRLVIEGETHDDMVRELQRQAVKHMRTTL